MEHVDVLVVGGGSAASTVVEGLFFVGTHFLRTRKSSTLLGVGEDAAIVARTIAERMPSA